MENSKKENRKKENPIENISIEENENLIEDQISSDAKQNENPIELSSNETGRGRKFKVSKDTQLKEYRSRAKDLLDAENNVLPASAPIFGELWKIFQKTISKKAIQLNVKNYASEIFGKNVVNIKKANECQKVSNDSEEEFFTHDKDGLTLSLNIDEKYKSRIKIIEGSGKRAAKTLEPGWTDALNDIIIEQTHIECVLKFKNVSVVGDEFVTVAKCSECNGTISARSSNNGKKLQVDIKNGDGTHTHEKRRRLTVNRAKSLVAALKQDTVFNVHSDLINEFDAECEFLPRNYVPQKSLSNIKHRYINNNLNSISALRQLKYTDYCDVIKEIGTDPFFVIFWTPLQKFLYSQISKRERCIISIDATGGLVSNIGLLADLTKKVQLPHIFLYLICIKNKEGASLPVAQCLSAQQDTTKIQYFLKRFIEEFGAPKEVNLDAGKALQKSCARVFAGCNDIAEYVKKCFSILNNGTQNNSFLRCFIRSDVSHFVFNLHKSTVFANVGVQVKHFYKCVIGTIMQTESYDEIKMIVQDMLILANYPIEGVLSDGSKAPTEESRIRLQRLIRTHQTNYMNTEIEQAEGEILLNDECADTKNDASCNVNSIEWYSRMVEEIKGNAKKIDFSPSNLSSNVSINNYQCSELNEFLQELLSTLPLWGCVMCKYFGSEIVRGNSCNVERLFGIIKSNIFSKYKLPVSAVVFVETLLKRINSMATLTKLTMNRKIIQAEADTVDFQEDNINNKQNPKKVS